MSTAAASKAPHHNGRISPRGIENRENDQPEGVIGNRKEEQERDCRVSCPEYEPRDEITESDVCGAWDGPAPKQLWNAKGYCEDHIEAGGTSHSAHGRDD